MSLFIVEVLTVRPAPKLVAHELVGNASIFELCGQGVTAEVRRILGVGLRAYIRDGFDLKGL